MAGGKFDVMEREHRETWDSFVRGATWMSALVVVVIGLMAIFLL
ncbi:MAG: aa3-type cytochrome c oxidase subunit IV [Alphaproteobacteria bacterium]